MSLLRDKNAHERDQFLLFDEVSHTYTCTRTKKKLLSATTFLGTFKTKFDPNEALEKMQFKNGIYIGTNKKYMQKTRLQIMSDWEELGKIASYKGTLIHDVIEYFLDEQIDSACDIQVAEFKVRKNVDKCEIEFGLFFSYHNDIQKKFPDIICHRLEWRIYCTDLGIAGTIDALYKNKKNDKYIICDWKRSKKISFYNHFQNFKAPLENLQECNFISYSLQLNLYKFLLEHVYNMQVESMYLLIVHPQNETYQYIKIPKVQTIIKKLFNFHKKEILFDIDKREFFSDLNKLKIDHGILNGVLPEFL